MVAESFLLKVNKVLTLNPNNEVGLEQAVWVDKGKNKTIDTWTFEHDRFLTNEQLEQMAKQETFLVPTLSPEARRVEANDPPIDLITKSWYQKATEVMYQTVAIAQKHGVAIVTGSDASMPYIYHREIAFEMQQLTQASLTIMQTLASTTKVAAAALGLGDQLGQIRPDLEADLILVNSDPSQDLAVLQRQDAIVAVIQQGKFIKEVKD